MKLNNHRKLLILFFGIICSISSQLSFLLAGSPFINGAFIKGVNLPWQPNEYYNGLGNIPAFPSWGCSYSHSIMSSQLADLHNMGITVVRLWLHEADQGLVLNSNKNVTGLDPIFLSNLDDTVALAASNGISLYLTLLNTAGDWQDSNLQSFYGSESKHFYGYITNSLQQGMYLSNAVIPLAKHYQGNTNIFAFDADNEIDGALSPSQPDVNQYTGAILTWQQARTYMSNVASAIHGADAKRLVSCSTGWNSYHNLSHFKGLGLDFYDFHDYETTATFPSASSLGMDKPIYIGECGQPLETAWNNAVQSNALSAIYSRGFGNGYSGAEAWAYNTTSDPEIYALLNYGSNGNIIVGDWRPVCYWIKNFNPPVISSIPVSAAVGTTIPITGQNFTGTTVVSINGTPVAGFKVNSSTQISVTLAPGVTSGIISVTNPSGTATSSSSLNVLLLTQAITFAQPSVQTYSPNRTFGLAATTTAPGGTVTFTSTNTNVITVSGSTATIHGTGTAVITANAAAIGNYAAATPVPRTVTVNKAAQTIIFNPTTPITLAATKSFPLSSSTTSGLGVTYSSSTTNVISISGTTATVKAKGTTSLTATQAGNANYNAATPVAKSVTVE